MKKTKKLIIGVISGMTAVGLSGCMVEEELPPEPTQTDCQDWEWDWEEGVYECDDYDSAYYNHYYHGGTYHSTKNSLHSDISYKSYKSSSSFKGSSGFGSGSSSFGG